MEGEGIVLTPSIVIFCVRHWIYGPTERRDRFVIARVTLARNSSRVKLVTVARRESINCVQ